MLEILNVSKTFNKGTINEKKALNKLSLHLNPGDFVTIIGGSYRRRTNYNRRSGHIKDA